MGKFGQNNKPLKKFILIFCLLACSSGLFPQTAVKIDSLGLNNLYQVDDGIFRSEQPNNQAFANLEKYGITEVVNLRYWHSDNKKAGKLILHRVPMRAGKIKEDNVVQVLKIIKNRKGNILIHCKHGADRTGLIIAMYRIVFQNWTKEQAIEEMTKGNFGFHGIYTNIIDYIRNVNVENIKEKIN